MTFTSFCVIVSSTACLSFFGSIICTHHLPAEKKRRWAANVKHGTLKVTSKSCVFHEMLILLVVDCVNNLSQRITYPTPDSRSKILENSLTRSRKARHLSQTLALSVTSFMIRRKEAGIFLLNVYCKKIYHILGTILH